MSKGARNRRIRRAVGGDKRLARKLRRVVGWNGKMPGHGSKAKNYLYIARRPRR